MSPDGERPSVFLAFARDARVGERIPFRVQEKKQRGVAEGDVNDPSGSSHPAMARRESDARATTCSLPFSRLSPQCTGSRVLAPPSRWVSKADAPCWAAIFQTFPLRQWRARVHTRRNGNQKRGHNNIAETFLFSLSRHNNNNESCRIVVDC